MEATLNKVPLPALLAATIVVIAGVLVALGVLGGNSLPERTGPPIETVSFERVEFEPGVVSLRLRNTGPDPVTIRQATVNDAYVDFSSTADRIGVKGSETFRLDFPWIEGQPYRIALLTETGIVIEHPIDAAVETPQADGGLFGLMALLGTYVGIIPVILGMLFLPVLRRAGRDVVRWLLAFTVGLLAFLAIDAFIEAIGIGSAGGAFGGVELVFLGAGAAFLLLVGVDRYISSRPVRGEGENQAAARGVTPMRLALMVAIGIGLHNLGEGLAIGSAYAIGELALGAALVLGFAIHNTTEGLAIVAPLGRSDADGKGENQARGTAEPAANGRGVPIVKLLGLGAIAGAPAILGAMIGVTVGMNEIAALLLGVGVGAIVQVIIQIAPALKNQIGQYLDVVTATGIVAGAILMYATGLLVIA